MHHILIVGASVAGLSTAYWLAQYGFRVTIVELNDGLRKGGQPIDIEGSAVDVITKMGTVDKVREYKTDHRGASRVNAAGEEIFRTEEYTFTGPRFDSTDIEILRDELVEILADVTLSLPDVSIRFADTVEEVISHDTGVVVQFRSGLTEEYWAVIGADGINSQVRESGVSGPIEFYPVRNDRLCIWSTENFLGLKQWQTFFNPTDQVSMGILTARKDRELRVIVSYPLPDDRYRNRDEWKEYTRSVFAQYPGWINADLAATLDDTVDFYSDTAKQVRLETWYKGRVVLVGDAGYCPSPYSGRGTPLAIIGAYVLAGELAQHKDPVEAFIAYENELRTYVENTQVIPFLGLNPLRNDDQTAMEEWAAEHLNYSLKDYSSIYIAS